MKLELKNIRVSFPRFRLQLHDVLEGEVIGVFGASGSGKTTLLDLIAGLRKPQSAFIQFNEVVFADTSSNLCLSPQLRRIGYLPQGDTLFPHLSVDQNIRYGAHQKMISTEFSGHVIEVLEIERLLDRSVLDLSGGEKQRIALARALFSQPKLILLDEPLASLDEPLKERSLSLLRRVQKEFSIPMIYVSHSIHEVMSLCNLVLILSQGALIRQGTPSELFEETTIPTLRLKQ